jgi:serine/threonine protein kinase
MSPEQALGTELDQRSDLFTVGLIFYELLTARMPYKADTALASLMKRTQERAAPVSSVDGSVPKALSNIVARCLERDPKMRYRTAREILQQLEAWDANPTIAPTDLARMAPAQLVVRCACRAAGACSADCAGKSQPYFPWTNARREHGGHP